ncbi:MAG: M3 family metallopeptidase [Puniceicoccales bacterium]|nr:M3 family metallopeptidase [Puniceicoccales bacterium]
MILFFLALVAFGISIELMRSSLDHGSKNNLVEMNNIMKPVEANENNSSDEFHPFCHEVRPIRWSRLNVESALRDVDYAIGLAQDRIAILRAMPLDQVSFENTIVAMEYINEELSQFSNFFGHLDAVANCDEITKAMPMILAKISKFTLSIPLDQELWKRVEACAKSKKINELSPTKKRLLKNVVDFFMDHGTNLDAKSKARLMKIDEELSQLCYEFGHNVLQARNAWEKFVTKDELLGLPESVMKSMAEDAEKAGRPGEYRVSLKDSYINIYAWYLSNEELRKEILMKARNLCRDDSFSNRDMARKILTLRDESSKLLGNDSHASFALKHNMLKTKADVDKFLAEVYENAKSQFNEDVFSLKDYAKEFYAHADPKGELTPWNVAYLYHKKMQHELDNFDKEQLRPYFEINHVMSGLFKIVEELYGIKIIEKKTAFLESKDDKCPMDCIEVWDKDVRYYEIFENNGDFIGGFFADLYPRKNKHSGAWCCDLIDGGLNSRGGWQHPVGVICANVTKPTQGEQSLLQHREVATIFHEFGHLMHLMFGNVEYPSINGYHVAIDFVELPSQLMENFCWERRSLDIFAKHHATGEPIPDDLFDKLLKSRTFMESLALMRQLELTVMDLELHGNYSKYHSSKSLDGDIDAVLSKYTIDYSEKPNNIMCQFSHIFSGGYASQYYSYMWSEVLDADAFTIFQHQDVVTREVGNLFRNKILSVGDSVDPLESFRNFAQRDPDIKPFLFRRGCLKSSIIGKEKEKK